MKTQTDKTLGQSMPIDPSWLSSSNVVIDIGSIVEFPSLDGASTQQFRCIAVLDGDGFRSEG